MLGRSDGTACGWRARSVLSLSRFPPISGRWNPLARLGTRWTTPGAGFPPIPQSLRTSKSDPLLLEGPDFRFVPAALLAFLLQRRSAPRTTAARVLAHPSSD